LKITDCIFTNNYNGTIFCPGTLTIAGCVFENNKATTGGAISCSYKSDISDCKFTSNIAANGGAIYSSGSACSTFNCIFECNEANNGGAIYGDNKCILNIAACTFIKNTATTNGGAVSSWSGDILNCTFENNTAEAGGAISVSSGRIVKSTFSNNSSGNGGAIYGSLNLKGNIFVNNKIIPDNILNDAKNAVSEGYNVYMSNQNTIFAKPTDYRYTGSQNLLISIGDYGGNTPTIPINTSILDWESIIRRVPIEELTTLTDQRGFPLPTTKLACAGSVEIQEGENFSGILNVEKSNIKVFPNPTFNIINYFTEENLNVQLYNVYGKLLYSRNCNVGENTIDVEGYPAGIYFLVVGKQSTKIIKE